MTDATILTGPWPKREDQREPRPHFGLKELGATVAACGDAFDVAANSKSVDPSLLFNAVAKLEQHAAHARLLAEEMRMLKLSRIRWDLIQEAERLERRAAELEADLT